MKKIIIIGIIVSLVAFMGFFAIGNKPAVVGDSCTTIQDGTLTYSTGHYLEGQSLKEGYDIFGYNYQAHMFKGCYCNVYLGGYGFPPYEGDDEAYYQRLVDEGYAENTLKAKALISGIWCWPYRDTWVNMKWNDAWLSNKDCGTQDKYGAYTNPTTPDGKLDRHYGYDSYIGSGAWETNHMWGTNGDGTNWDYFCKIVAVPADAYTKSLLDAYGNPILDAYGNPILIWYAADGVEIGPDIWGQFAVIQEVSNDPGAGEHGILYLSPAGPGFGKFAP